MSSVLRSAITLSILALLFAAPSSNAQLSDDASSGQQRREAIRAQFIAQQEPNEPLEPMALTPCSGGFAGSYPCSEIDLLAFMPNSSIGGGSGNDIWGWTDPMTGNEYALMGRSSGTSFVDITDPENPVYLGNLPTHTSNSSWRDIKVYANHAYIVSEASGHGMQVFDLTQLRSVAAPPTTFSETAHYSNFGSAHNVAINEDTGYAYAIGTGSCSGGPHFVDLSTPTAPVFAGCHPETLYTHDTQCVVYTGPDSDYSGREICFNSNETRINIIDVTDHSNSFLISSFMYGGTGYVHQGWLTEDQKYYMQGDELDEQNFGHNTRTRILDVSDLDSPSLIANYDHATAAIDHNLYTHDGLVYMANYRAGLRIMETDDIANGNLVEVAYFDIYPSSNSASFNGAWSVYPYFESGTVVVSGIEQGLFILKPKFAPSFALEATPTTLAVCEPDLETIDLQLIEDNGYVGDVTVSTSGLPAGIVDTFSVNPITVPGSSELSLNVNGATPGSYSFDISATDGILTDEQSIDLTITNQPAGTVFTQSPASGSSQIPRTPTLIWGAASQAANYTVEIATDPGFSAIVYSVSTPSTIHIVSASLETLTTHFWRVRANNPCGTGPYSGTANFTTLDVPDILLVDDDDNSPDVSAEYKAALQSLGRDFDVWDTNGSDDEPSIAALAPYKSVIWFTGDAFGGSAGPGPGGEQALSAWLDGAGCILIASQDYLYDRGQTALMEDYLGVSSATGDIMSSTADGRGSVYGNLGPYSLAFPYQSQTDTILNDGSSERAFQGSIGGVGVNKDGGSYRTTYLGFGLEGLPNTSDVADTLSAYLNWCDDLFFVDTDSDGTLDSDDCDPNNSSVWSAPSAVYGLTLTEAASNNLNWSAPAATGSSSVTYDLLRSDGATDFIVGSCLESSDSDTTATDAATPASGAVFYYLIRVENSCGENLGNGGTRSGIGCP